MERTELLVLVDHLDWARERVLAAVETVPAEERRRELGASFESLQGTLAHIAGAEAVWLGRLEGQDTSRAAGEREAAGVVPFPGAETDLEPLRTNWRRHTADLRRFVADAREGPDMEIRYRDSKGNVHRATLAEIVQHVSLHGSYHRGQVTHMLRQLGHAPVATDFIVFQRERQKR